MNHTGLGVQEEALAGYAAAAPGLAADLDGIGNGTLAGVASLPAGAFGQIGDEVGLGAAFQQSAQRGLDAVAAASRGLTGLGTAVGDALRQYQETDAESGDRLRHAAQG